MSARAHRPRRSPSARSSLLAASALAAATLAVVPAAGAATLGLDQRCYVAGEKASVSGSGFVPRTAITVTRGAESVTGATADNSGAMRGTLVVPEVAFGLVESQVEVAASDGTNSASALLNIAKVGATYTPRTGDPSTLRVSHVISGFGLAETKPSIYLHYVSPAAQRAMRADVTGAASTTKARTDTKPAGGSSTAQISDPPGVRTIRLGQLRGPCGVLRTSPRRLLPFKTTPGTWLLQYDTRAKYTRGTVDSPFLWVSEKLKITG